MNKACLLLIISAFFLCTNSVSAADKPGTYTAWGVDEYEFFGLTKDEVKKRFKGKLSFDKGFERVHFFGENVGCMGYLGPTFKLHFVNDKVSSVQGIFEGCKDNFIRPELKSKKEALEYAVKGLASSENDKDKLKLKSAQSELAGLTISSKPKDQK